MIDRHRCNVEDLTRVYEERYHLLVLLARCYLHDQAEAEDVVQSTMEYLLTHTYELDDVQDLYPFIRYKVRKEARRLNKIKLKAVPMQEDTLQWMQTRDAPQEGDDLRGEKLRKAMETMPKDAVRALERHVLDGERVDAMAEGMNIKANTLSQRISRVRKALRHQLPLALIVCLLSLLERLIK